MIGYLQKCETFYSINGKPKQYDLTRWESIQDSLVYMSQQKNAINGFYETKQKAKPSSLWWIVLFGLLPAAKEQTKCFKKMLGN